MKIQFESQQAYQLAAVQSIVDVFEGQPLAQGSGEIRFGMAGASIEFSEKGVANQLVVSEEQLLENVQAIQTRNELPPLTALDGLNFTVEMETGTGKTYTYLRTIYALNQTYGFLKFVIVVPSVAIREGVMKNLQITHEHLQSLYDNPPLNFFLYDARKLTNLRSFAVSNAIQVMVINIDSFATDANIINKVSERGIRPVQYLQDTRPVVIVDEPQNMETDIRKAAIQNLNPLCTLRYSATHRHRYNLVYKLDPVRAYDLGLVKQIEVCEVTAAYNQSAALVQLVGIEKGKKGMKANITVFANSAVGVVPRTVKVEPGNDLFDFSGGRDVYRDGFIVNEIDRTNEVVKFSGGLVLKLGQNVGGLRDEIERTQIEETVKAHFAKEAELSAQGVKVLSLFFIDKVVNYRRYDPDGKPQAGKFANWFEEFFDKHKPSDYPLTARQVHDGYFSQDNQKRIKDTSGVTRADNETYALIMQKKEQLLSNDEPLRFIFSHSALREGWDNPNVFQICTLNETESETRKRQEIGRGLRLAVNQKGERIQDKAVNVLTVVANQSYEEFTRKLQQEIEEDTGVSFTGRIKNAREKGQVQLSKELTPENFPLFFEIWELIQHRTRYRVEYTTAALIEKAVAGVKAMPRTTRPQLAVKTAKISMNEKGVEADLEVQRSQQLTGIRYTLPDVYGYIQSKINLTRRTIFQVLKQSERWDELEINPQLFLDNVVGVLRSVLEELLVDGVKYERINGSLYEMQIFKNEEIETYLSNLLSVKKPEKTLFNYYPKDSQTEADFARACEADQAVKFFFKLPRKFEIPTPIGMYRPDWAVVFEQDKRIYFVAETKSDLDPNSLRGDERMKIECGKRHFALFKAEGVEYRAVTKLNDLND